ncbi:hypothetical protein PV10_01307 [Exophiala mesophila]|uniref:Vezatin n=1 Tax=Exophiala mesophila TaxID=212818 RepID=A0A0D1X6W7_EXOME|nr:uncharacterized protein PV10_01307 [Exophiala mesophila]KIV97575.1 hypothetical protein PV10_01307 [Exophiala mesophila]
MEALIYDESPLAEYLEGDANAFDLVNTPPTSPSNPIFAPKGLPKLRESLRAIRETAASVSDVTNERFLEKFRYNVIASQLLSDDSKPRRQHVEETLEHPSFSVRGAFLTASLSFAIAWLLHSLRRRYLFQQSFSFSETFSHILVLIGGGLILFYLGRRQYLEFIRRSAAFALSDFILLSLNIDSTATEALRFIQEVEVVSRGYDISQPMPPVSRLEDAGSRGHCSHLRKTIAETIALSIRSCVQFHETIQPHVRESDLQRYRDIYDVSMQDYPEYIALAEHIPADAQYMLKDLRLLFRLHFSARKVFLCDLLALHSGSTWQNIKQWRVIVDSLRSLNATYSDISVQLQTAMKMEASTDNCHELPTHPVSDASAEDGVPLSPRRLHTKAQMRRFDAVANAVRSLNAKVRLIKDDLDSISLNDDDSTYSAAMVRHYENLGTDLRNALVEWEKGRNTMFLKVGVGQEKRVSSASSLLSPASPSPSSIGGQTMVDGSPADALRLLSGDKRRSSDESLDEEVFEAVALPRKRMSWAPMSREEKLNKMQEDRRKRATMLEQAENTTNMLRELQMVIKHRPNARIDTRISSV